MLVLTRKLKETIRIGDDITVTIVRVKGQSVRVGIEAPREVRVIRGELPEENAKKMDEEESADDVEEPQVVQFRFTPSETNEKAPLSRFMARGAIASMGSALMTSGVVAEGNPE